MPKITPASDNHFPLRRAWNILQNRKSCSNNYNYSTPSQTRVYTDSRINESEDVCEE
jgi:hypothetical protein